MGAMAGGGGAEAPVRFEDVIVYFSKDEWGMLEKWQKDLYWKVLTDNYDALVVTGHPVTKSDILAWVEGCERLGVKGSRQSSTTDAPGTLCATNGRITQMCLKERAEEAGSLEAAHERAQEGTAQRGNVGESENPHSSGGKRGNPPKEEPFPHAGYEKDGQGLASLTHSQRTAAAPKPYKCGECGKRFRLKKLLQLHQISMKNEPFPCPKCRVRFPSTSYLRMHQWAHLHACAEGEKASLRENCPSTRHGSGALERLNRCAECRGSFHRYLDLLQHQKGHDEPKPWPCPQCGDMFLYQSDLAMHEERHLEEALAERAACGGGCVCECSLLLHFASRLGQSTGGSEAGSPGHEPLLREAYSKEEKPYSCAQCGLLFKLEVNLEVHHRYCRKGWLSEHELNRNPRIPLSGPREVHAEQKINHSVLGGSQGDLWSAQRPSQSPAQHACAECGKRFSFKFKLHRHWQKHKAGKRGGVAKHGTSFGRSSGSPQTASVTKKLHKCQECGEKFVYKWQLDTHLKGECYRCPSCGEKFGCKSSLGKHRQMHAEEAACENGTPREDVVAPATNRRAYEETKQLYRCVCGKSLAKDSLRIHRAFHAGVRYKCLLCGKVSNFRSTATAHCKTHRDFPTCPKCGETGGSRPCRCMIERIHVAPGSQPRDREGMSRPSEGLPPECLYPKHGERIPSDSRLHFERHISAGEQSARAEHPKKRCRKPKVKPASRNSRPKPFRCRDCGKDFAYLGHLITHRRVHTGEYPSQCAECGKGFIHRRYLDMHWKIHAKESG